MKIIVAINEKDFKKIEAKIKKAVEFLPQRGWIQFDVADGKFTRHKTWNRPKELKSLQPTAHSSRLSIEVHLMVLRPEGAIDRWVRALRSRSGQGRIIIHIETMEKSKIKNQNEKSQFKIKKLFEKTKKHKIELGIAVNPETAVEKLIPFISVNQLETSVNQRIRFVQILAVSPGKSGQKFDKRVLDKIKFLKKNYPRVKIEVDGGINLETAKMCKKAGADILVAGSYIWNDVNPREAYKRLKRI